MSGERPVIIKKKVKKRGHKHHGGSWKVAYADFVTAMMAFFLLMWLLASVNPEDKAEIAGYFRRPLKSVFTKGDHAGGDRLVSTSDGSPTPGLLSPGSDTSSAYFDTMELERLREELEEEVQNNPVLRPFSDQLRFELTADGLSILIIDRQNRPMFANGSAALQSYTTTILREIARFLNAVPNRITIAGHTDAQPYAGGEARYSNWELSADRANAARRVLVAGGIVEGKILRVEGLSSTALLDPDNPFNPANRRITILLLNPEAEQDYWGSGVSPRVPLPSATVEARINASPAAITATP